MASRHLARAAASADDYRRVYREVLASATTPVVLHWLGTAFDPSLAGYFGSTDWARHPMSSSRSSARTPTRSRASR